MGPLVARVSAAIYCWLDVVVSGRLYLPSLTTTPPSYKHPTMVVPVLVAFGKGTPAAWRAKLRSWFEKSKPGIMELQREAVILDGIDKAG